MDVNQKIVFIGSSGLGLQKLISNSFFSVIDVLCLENRVNENLKAAANLSNIKITLFKWIADFRKIINRYPVEILFFIYQLDMLVPAELTLRYNFYNLHRGNLHTNRGPNPDIWPILNGDKETCLSLHRINDKIDSGILIDTYQVSIAQSDDTGSVKAKLEEGLPAMINSLENYMKGKQPGTELGGGIYRPWITESDFTIDLNRDAIEIMLRKIRCQRQYNGAILILGERKVYVTEIMAVQKIADETFPFAQLDDVLKIMSGEYLITFRVNLNPKYPPPPKFPISKRV